MNPFHVYLKSELGKLKNEGDAAWFLKSMKPQALEACGLKTTSTELVNLFSNQDNVNAFVQTLTDLQAQLLTKSCDKDWRKNGVFNELSRHATWAKEIVPIDLVDIQLAEPSVADVFKRHRFRLTEIARDPMLWTVSPYREWDLSEAVHFGIALGRLKSRRYKLFDGIHRAILLCRQGSESLEICFYNAPGPIGLVITTIADWFVSRTTTS